MKKNLSSWYEVSFVLTFSTVILAFSGCGGDDENYGGENEQATTLQANLDSAIGLLSVDEQSGGGGSSITIDGMTVTNASYAALGSTGDVGSPLYKINEDGTLSHAINVNQGKYSFGGAPLISTIALSPASEVFLHFERPFTYREPPKCDYSGEGEDGENSGDSEECNIDYFSMSSGYQCQLFRISGGTVSALRGKGDTAIECIDNQHMVESWSQDAKSLFQFDRDSTLFYPGVLPDRWDTVLYSLPQDGFNLMDGPTDASEAINANICIQDYLITQDGSVFYTGMTDCQNGGGGSDGGFFRYVAPGNASVREIARGWWDFVYEPVESDEGDQVIFYGPDPTSSSTNSWDTASLFQFDPAITTTMEEATTELVTAGQNIWDYINMSRAEDVIVYGTGYSSGNSSPTTAWITEFANRCASEGDTFVGGGSRISAIKRASDGTVYVIGNVQVKREGEVSCNLDVKGSHCLIAGIPYLEVAAYDTASECSTAGGTWEEDDGWCSNGDYGTHDTCTAASSTWNYNSVWYSAASPLCTSSSSNKVATAWSETVTATTSTESTAKFSANWMNCNTADGTSDWLDEYKAFARVNSSTKSLTMLSSADEQAIHLWIENDVLYFSSYSSYDGKYYFKKYDPSTDATTTLLENFEIYNLETGQSDEELYYDGLNFANNSYSFGVINVNTGDREEKTGLTGKVKTIIVLP